MKIIKIFIYIFLIFFNASLALSEDKVLKKIEINGNQRIPSSYISEIVSIYSNKKITDEVINNLTKQLFISDFFEDIKISFRKSTLYIEVVEKSIISEIFFEGNDLLEIEQLNSIIDLKRRDTYSEKKINLAKKKIRNEYAKLGRYKTKISVKKEILEQSRVNIIFSIDEGEITKINKINISGNSVFSNNELKRVLVSKEASFYRIFGSSVFNFQNMEVDKSKLKSFYNERGYIDFKVLSYRRDLLRDYSAFNINIIVNEGKRFKINNVIVENNLFEKEKSTITEKLSIKKDEFYDQRAIDESLLFLNDFFGKLGYSFVDIKTNLSKLSDDKIDIKFVINEGLKTYIRNIEIIGNTRTLDSVIRREVILIEGDPFNSLKLKNSINAIKRLGYFKKVDVNLKKTPIQNEVDIIIEVRESLTGSFALGLGYDSIDKTQISFGLKEKNFLGKGLKTRIDLSTSEKSTKYNVGITDPYYDDLPILVSGDVFDQNIERGDRDIDKTGFSLALGYDINEYFNKISYSLVDSKTTKKSSSSSLATSGEEGVNIITSSLSYLVSLDTRDNSFQPKSGYKMSTNASYAGIGGDTNFIKLETGYSKYVPFNYGNYVLSMKGKLGVISSLESEKVTSSNRFSFNSRYVRGFDSNGIGPRDTGSDVGVGGNKYYAGTMELRTKKFVPEDSGVEVSVFSDVGSLWDTDYPSNVKGVDDSGPRISAGVSLYWTTGIGPLNFTWGWPVQKESYDKENNFRFSIGTFF